MVDLSTNSVFPRTKPDMAPKRHTLKCHIALRSLEHELPGKGIGVKNIAASVLVGLCWALMPLPAWSETQDNASLTVSIAAPAYWCPYACDMNESRSGFTVEIARAALESMGHQVVYQNLPYGRALFEVKNGDIDATIPTFKSEAPRSIFPKDAVSLTEYCFYVPEDESWRYTGLESLDNIRIVATSGYTYGESMDAYIAENLDEGVTLIKGSKIPNRLRKLIRRERFDALLDDRLLFESSQNATGLVNAGCLDERHAGYLALTPENPDRSNTIAQAFEHGLRNLRASGQLCRILQKYKLSPKFVPGLDRDDCSSDHQ